MAALSYAVMQAMAHWTGQGYRVLGLAVGKLLPATAADKQQLSRLNLLTLKQHVSDLRMIGLAIIHTQLRPDTVATIKQLHARSVCTHLASSWGCKKRGAAFTV